MRTRIPSIRWWAILVCLGCLTAIALGKRRFERATTRRVETLLSAASADPAGTYRPEDPDALPEPVRRYFTTVLDLEDGVARARSVRLEQRGEFRLGGRSGSWKPMTATQHYTVDPPGFVWNAEIELGPFVSVNVVDAYEFGSGSLRARVLSVLPVASVDPSPAMNEGELLRYLAEAVWFPTALLPAAGVEWRVIDDRTAEATIEDGNTTASLTFHFDDENLVERVSTAERYRQESESGEPWVGRFDRYETRGAVRIPTKASVEWALSGGALPYWRAEISSIEHRRA